MGCSACLLNSWTCTTGAGRMRREREQAARAREMVAGKVALPGVAMVEVAGKEVAGRYEEKRASGSRLSTFCLPVGGIQKARATGRHVVRESRAKVYIRS